MKTRPPLSGQEARTNERLSRMELSLENLSRRVGDLERGQSDSTAPRTFDSSTTPISSFNEKIDPLEQAGVSSLSGRIIPLFGRSCLVICGAFLLRALTESNFLPHGLGIALGMVYATAWLVAAGRAGKTANGRIGAEFHAATALVIAFPILVETTHRFELMNATAAAAGLSAFSAAGLILFWRTRLPVSAWLMSASGAGTAVVLARSTAAIEVFGAYLVVFGITTLWLAELRTYPGTKWFPALGADLLILAGSLIVATPGGAQGPYGNLSPTLMLGSAIGLLVGYLGSAAVKLVTSCGKVEFFDVAQTGAAVLISLVGAARILDSSMSGSLITGSVAAVFGLAFYALAFAFVERRHGRGAPFLFATSLGLALTTLGGMIALRGTAASIAWASLGIAAAYFGGQFDRITLRVHAAIFLGLAAVTSGLGAATTDALFRAGAKDWRQFSFTALIVLASLTLTYALLVISPSAREKRWYARVPRFVLAALTGTSLLALYVRLLVRFFPGGAENEALLAACRTSLLAAAALGLAALGRNDRLRELTWLVYPMLLIATGRLLFVDLRVGSGVTLFPTFGIFGIVLLLTPRLLRELPTG